MVQLKWERALYTALKKAQREGTNECRPNVENKRKFLIRKSVKGNSLPRRKKRIKFRRKIPQRGNSPAGGTPLRP